MNFYRNHSGLYDPTAGAALSHICHEEKVQAKEERQCELRTRPLVYICSKYAGEVEVNTYLAAKYCRYAIKQGRIPVASHLMYPQVLNDNDPRQREMGLQFGLALLLKCSEVWVFNENRELSEGMRVEIKFARLHGKTVKYFDKKEIQE